MGLPGATASTFLKPARVFWREIAVRLAEHDLIDRHQPHRKFVDRVRERPLARKIAVRRKRRAHQRGIVMIARQQKERRGRIVQETRQHAIFISPRIVGGDRLSR